MKVLFIARASLYRNKGGDTIQVLKTAEYLATSGVTVDIRLADEDIDYSGYQLLHFFNLIRPADILKHTMASPAPYVVSPIFVNYSEADKLTRPPITRLLLRFFSEDRIEYFKVIARWLLNGEKVVSLSYLFRGHGRSVHAVLKDAAMLLPNSENEYRRLHRKHKSESTYRIIPNAVDDTVFKPGADQPAREDDLVLCVGRLERRKNQLNLIKAVNDSSFRLILIGAPATNQTAYYEECRKTAGRNVSFIDALSQQELLSYYSRARIHALPSWFETTGLSSLEAAVMGCSLVITDKGDTREYFEDDACYCDPSSPTSILEALKNAVKKEPSEKLRTRILSQYTWAHAAEKTFMAYREILDYPQWMGKL